MKSYKPIPSHWGKPLSKFEHYCCYMLRNAGCDCDFPDIQFPIDCAFEGMNNVCWCGECDTETALNATEKECGDWNFPSLEMRKRK